MLLASKLFYYSFVLIFYLVLKCRLISSARPLPCTLISTCKLVSVCLFVSLFLNLCLHAYIWVLLSSLLFLRSPSPHFPIRFSQVHSTCSFRLMMMVLSYLLVAGLSWTSFPNFVSLCCLLNRSHWDSLTRNLDSHLVLVSYHNILVFNSNSLILRKFEESSCIRHQVS